MASSQPAMETPASLVRVSAREIEIGSENTSSVTRFSSLVEAGLGPLALWTDLTQQNRLLWEQVVQTHRRDRRWFHFLTLVLILLSGAGLTILGRYVFLQFQQQAQIQQNSLTLARSEIGQKHAEERAISQQRYEQALRNLQERGDHEYQTLAAIYRELYASFHQLQADYEKQMLEARQQHLVDQEKIKSLTHTLMLREGELLKFENERKERRAEIAKLQEEKVGLQKERDYWKSIAEEKLTIEQWRQLQEENKDDK